MNDRRTSLDLHKSESMVLLRMSGLSCALNNIIYKSIVKVTTYFFRAIRSEDFYYFNEIFYAHITSLSSSFGRFVSLNLFKNNCFSFSIHNQNCFLKKSLS